MRRGGCVTGTLLVSVGLYPLASLMSTSMTDWISRSSPIASDGVLPVICDTVSSGGACSEFLID